MRAFFRTIIRFLTGRIAYERKALLLVASKIDDPQEAYYLLMMHEFPK